MAVFKYNFLVFLYCGYLLKMIDSSGYQFYSIEAHRKAAGYAFFLQAIYFFRKSSDDYV